VTHFTKGQRVIPLIFNKYVTEGFGIWRDYLEIAESDLIRVPGDISDELASQFFITPWLVYGILKEIDIPRGGYLISNAAGSVVGRLVSFSSSLSLLVAVSHEGLVPMKSFCGRFQRMISVPYENMIINILHPYRQLVQLAKHLGIKTINIVRRDEYVQDLKALGADEVINSSTEGPLHSTKHV
jgi:trans-2-enoyl-CoA reductase